MAKQEDDSRMSWTATLLALPPIGVFFLGDFLSGSFAWQGAAPKLSEPGSAAVGLDPSNRLLVLAAALAGFATAYLIVLRFAADLRDEFGPNTRRWLLGWYAGGVLLGAAWVLSGYAQVPINSQLGKNALNEALGLFGSAEGVAGDRLLHRFETLALYSRLALMLAAGIVVTGGVSSLVDPIRALDNDEAHAFLQHQRARLRSYVNAAAALLVVSLAFQVAWMRWSLIAFDPAATVSMGRHVDAFAIFTGVTGSVVIALFAVPASTILSARAAALPQPSATPGEPLLDPGLLPNLGKILVVLAPTLAGSLPTILDVMGRW
jgi:hypothetical protein